ncbi:unnamed protein product, partial [Dibothriocephalus latus]
MKITLAATLILYIQQPRLSRIYPLMASPSRQATSAFTREPMWTQNPATNPGPSGWLSTSDCGLGTTSPKGNSLYPGAATQWLQHAPSPVPAPARPVRTRQLSRLR